MARKKSLMKLRRCIVKLRRFTQLLQPIEPTMSDNESCKSLSGTALVPKEHFAILLGKTAEDQQRFVVQLKYLRNPALINLLKEAEDEYGFRQEGTLIVPCSPKELQKILEDSV